MDIKHILSQMPKSASYLDQSQQISESIPAKFVRFPGGLVEIGHGQDGFSYDNECPRHKVYLDAFELQNRCVTNSEYLQFIQSGGYSNPQYWLSDGWQTVQSYNWCAPLYWRCQHGQWQEYTLAGWQPLNLNQPVCHVSFYEAHAYAQWAEARLPTEAEWESAAEHVRIATGQFWQNYTAPASAVDDFSDFLGHVWQWTNSAYLPYPGYSPFQGALAEYNGKFMCNQMVLRGGCFATAADHYRPTYRNFFYPHQRWQFSGIRLAR